MASTAVFGATAAWLLIYDFKRSPAEAADDPRGKWPQPQLDRPTNWPEAEVTEGTIGIVVLPTAPWHRAFPIGKWRTTVPLSGSSYQVKTTSIERGALSVDPVSRGLAPAIDGSSGNFTFQHSFRHGVAFASPLVLDEFLSDQTRDLHEAFRFYDPTLVQVGKGNSPEFSAPNRPERYLQDFRLGTEAYLCDVIVFWDGQVVKTATPNPYSVPDGDGEYPKPTLENAIILNVNWGTDVLTLLFDAWSVGFRPGMVLSVGKFDLQDHPGGDGEDAGGIDVGCELVKIEEIRETVAGNGDWRVVVLQEPVRRPPQIIAGQPVSYTAGLHVRGFVGLYREVAFQRITAEINEQTGRLATLNYNFLGRKRPLIQNLSRLVPFGTTTGIFTAETDDTLTSSGHGLVNDDRVVLWADPGAAMPGGLNAKGAYYVVLTSKTFTDANVNAGANTIAIASHGFSSGEAVRLYGMYLPAPLLEGVDYYVIVVDGNTVKLSAVAGPGTEIDLTTTGTGTMKLGRANTFKVSTTLGGGAVDVTSTGSGTRRWVRIEAGGIGEPGGAGDLFKSARWP
jgi:hypothetical protein